MEQEIRIAGNSGPSGLTPPVGVSGGFMPHPQSMPIYGPFVQGGAQPGQTGQKSQFTKTSMFFMALALMMMGSALFFGGLLCGVWLSGGKTNRQVAVDTSQAGVTGSGLPSDASQEFSDLGLSNMASGQLAYQAQTAVNKVDTSHLPTFLQPFANQVKYTVAGQAQAKTSQVIGGAMQTAPVAGRSAPGTVGSGDTGTTGAGGESATHPTTKDAVGGEYAIQLGIYAAKENAESFQDNLKGMGFDSYIVSGKDKDGQDVYYVRVGHYGSHKFASIVAAQFNSQGIPGVTIIKEEKKK